MMYDDYDDVMRVSCKANRVTSLTPLPLPLYLFLCDLCDVEREFLKYNTKQMIEADHENKVYLISWQGQGDRTRLRRRQRAFDQCWSTDRR